MATDGRIGKIKSVIELCSEVTAWKLRSVALLVEASVRDP